MLSAVPCRPNALLVRLTFKESWDADNNPATSCCEKTFCMVAEFFDTALVILAGVTLRKHIHTHTHSTQPRPSTPLYTMWTQLFVYSRIFHYYSPQIPLFQLGIINVCLYETWLIWHKLSPFSHTSLVSISKITKTKITQQIIIQYILCYVWCNIIYIISIPRENND